MTIFHGRKNLRHRLFNSPIGILLDGDLQDKYLIQSITGIERVYEAGLYRVVRSTSETKTSGRIRITLSLDGQPGLSDPLTL